MSILQDQDDGFKDIFWKCFKLNASVDKFEATFLAYRNEAIDLRCSSMDWFLYYLNAGLIDL